MRDALDPSGQEKRVIAKTGRPNGLAVDEDGTIWVAESLHPSVVEDDNGQVEIVGVGENGLLLHIRKQADP